MYNAGWHAHTLDAPGKFLISAPEHPNPKRARAYLITDADIADTARRHSASSPVLNPPHGIPDGPQNDTDDPESPEKRLGRALLTAPEEGISVPTLVRATGMSRPTLYRRLTQLVRTGRVLQVSRGRYRAKSPDADGTA
jgi:S-DNA-T family DNA segregation ATPase FtsK/SpoIIIE